MEKYERTEEPSSPSRLELVPSTDNSRVRDIARGNRWADKITAAWVKSVEGIVETGRFLIQAKEDLPHGGFMEMVRMRLPFSQSTANRLMKIADHPVISNSAHWPNLPASWRTLYEISKHDPETVEDLLEAGKIKPEMTGKNVKDLFRKRRQPARSQKSSSPPSFSTQFRRCCGQERRDALDGLDAARREALIQQFLKVIDEELEQASR